MFSYIAFIFTQQYILEKPFMTLNVLSLQQLGCFPLAEPIFQVKSYTYLPMWKQKK